MESDSKKSESEMMEIAVGWLNIQSINLLIHFYNQ